MSGRRRDDRRITPRCDEEFGVTRNGLSAASAVDSSRSDDYIYLHVTGSFQSVGGLGRSIGPPSFVVTGAITVMKSRSAAWRRVGRLRKT
jgi:hypothetical protein